MSSERPAHSNGNSRETSESSEALVFQSSAANTLGVELELQIIDPQSGDLSPGAVRILGVCQEVGLTSVTAELMQSMVELKTGICRNVQEVEAQLRPDLRRLRNIANSLGLELTSGGTHPFHRGVSSAVFPDERYARIQDRLAWLTYQRVVFGLHVHVGVPNGDIAMGVTSMLTRYLPHLLAASANSPYWHGEDTGLASCRTALYRMLPHAGVPRYFRDWKEFRNFYRVMRDCRAIQSSKDIYWDIRPCPGFGTIEVRVCDMPPTLEIALGLVALIHGLVISTQRLLEERPLLRRGDIRRHWVAIENKWLATRYGLQAMYIRTPSGKRRLLAHDLRDLIERLQPIAEEQGDAGYLKALYPVDRFETGAARQRRIFHETGDWKKLVAEMTRHWAEGL